MKYWHHRLLIGLLSSTVLTYAEGAVAQSTDPSQLETLGHIQDSQDARRIALENAQQQAQRQAEARIVAQQRAAARAAAQARARALAARQAAEAQATREHQDDRSYLDANRSLDLQERQLQLKMIEAKANHADDFVKQELQHQQTTNDIARAASESDQKLKEDTGQAVKMSQRHWWQWWD